MKKSTLFPVLLLIMISMFLIPACKTEHKIAVETPKPIKIEARIDIYLHATSIEDMVSGKTPIPEVDVPASERESLLFRIFSINEACADEISFKSMTKEVQGIIVRRKDRFNAITSLINEGKAKEDDKGYLTPLSGLTDGESKLIEEENKDRKGLYKELAKQNDLPLEKVEKAFAKAHDGK